MRTHKVVRIGNSLGIVIPRATLERLRLVVGDEIFLTESRDGCRLTSYHPLVERQLTAAQEYLRTEHLLLRAIGK